MTQPRVLLFDVMDTLVYNPFNQEIPAFFGLDTQELIAQKHPNAWVQFELGEISESEYLQCYFANGRVFDHPSFLQTVADAYRWMDGVQPLLAQLHGLGWEIHALSNYPVWYQTIEAKLGLSRYLRWTFVSCLTGVRKPDPQAFLGVGRRLLLAPQDCLFIDDSLANCHAAESVGIPSIHFQDVADLYSKLREHQVICH